MKKARKSTIELKHKTQMKALEMWEQGFKPHEIARKLKFKNAREATKAINAALKRCVEEDAESGS